MYYHGSSPKLGYLKKSTKLHGWCRLTIFRLFLVLIMGVYNNIQVNIGLSTNMLVLCWYAKYDLFVYSLCLKKC